jgi:hypothetical protein
VRFNRSGWGISSSCLQIKNEGRPFFRPHCAHVAIQVLGPTGGDPMTTLSQFEPLTQCFLSGRQIDAVGFVDQLLRLPDDYFPIRCSLSDAAHLRFGTGTSNTEIKVPVEAAKAKLRMLLARLAVLAAASAGEPLSPYVGKGTIIVDHSGSGRRRFDVHYENTVNCQHFLLQSQS